jgi:predicted DNA-binding protein YlxM (UPF0122 family)
MTVKVKEFTVSCSYDIFRAGDKTSTFVSMNLTMDEPCSVEDFPIIQLDAADQVTRACIYDALARGAFSVEEANAKLLQIETNTKKMKDRLLSKKESPDQT